MGHQIDRKSGSFNKVVVIGLGQLGFPVAKYAKDKGFDVSGYDINAFAMEQAEKELGIKRITSFEDIDVFIVCVSTHRSDDIFSPQVEGIFSVVQKISKEAKKGSLLSIESTVPKGTSKKVSEFLEHKVHVVHAPHRWYSEEENIHGVNQPRVIGGVSSCCLEMGMNFYDSIKHGNQNSTTFKSLDISMCAVSRIEVAELTKIIENADRYLQIAFAEDLYLYCSANGIDFSELRNALNTKWNVNILEPRGGIGGHCVPKDTKMFLDSSNSIKSKILLSALEVDQDYRNYLSLQNKRYQTNSAQ
jgi:UDP-N-acetyl-D-mannosaminuronic acid dehydrogenase